MAGAILARFVWKHYADAVVLDHGIAEPGMTQLTIAAWQCANTLGVGQYTVA